MNKVKEFLKTVYTELSVNFLSVAREFPYTSGALFLAGFVMGALLFRGA